MEFVFRPSPKEKLLTALSVAGKLRVFYVVVDLLRSGRKLLSPGADFGPLSPKSCTHLPGTELDPSASDLPAQNRQRW